MQTQVAFGTHVARPINPIHPARSKCLDRPRGQRGLAVRQSGGRVHPVLIRGRCMMTGELERIRKALQFIPARDRDTWVRMGMAVKSALGEAGFDVWEGWSSQDESFDPKAARVVWRSLLHHGKVTAGTLFHEARKHGWCDDGKRQKPTPEALGERRRIAAERAAKEQASIERGRAEAAKKAAAIWSNASPARPDHHYLSRKHVCPVASLREVDAGAAAVILGYSPKSKGEALSGRLLVVPAKLGNTLSTLELIDEAGRKSALYGGAKAQPFQGQIIFPSLMTRAVATCR